MSEGEGYCDLTELPVEWCGHCRGSKTLQEEVAAEDKKFDTMLDRWGKKK